MDASTLRDLLALSLEPNAEMRQRAESQLKQFETHPGFLSVLLDVMERDPEDRIRLSAIIYVKNRVHRTWIAVDSLPDEVPLSDAERAMLKERILSLLLTSQSTVRLQIKHIIHRMLNTDTPDQWPYYMTFTMDLLNTNHRDSVMTGIDCLLAVCRAYRWKSSETADRFHLDNIIEASFPRLLAICNELVAQESDEAGTMCHLALKVYKHAEWIELSPFLRQHSNVVAWCEVFLRTVSKPLPPATMTEEDPLEREKMPWIKAKKWAYVVLNRMFVRYGNASSLRKSIEPGVPQFAKDFTATIAPEILRHYLQEVEKWVSKTVWLSRSCLCNTFQFLSECIEPNAMWHHLQPHVPNLMTHFVFPVMCLTDEEQELFDEEPEEFLLRRMNFFDDSTFPGLAATHFLGNLAKNRRKETFEILKFVNTIVNEYEQSPIDKKNHVAKEGALRMIGTLAPIILGKKSPIAGQVEYFLVRYVFPDFKNEQGYLRSRACDTIEKFERLNFQDPQNLLTIYRNIIECMADPKLPVRVMAALALQPLIRHKVIRSTMQQSIPNIVQHLLKLINETDVDALANVMEDFVEVFSVELTPFAVAISEQLRDTYLRIVGEMLQNLQEQGHGEHDHYDDKNITALGVLQTIGTLILTLESTPEVLFHIESILMPVIRVTLENKLSDLYNEVFEIVDSCTFAAKTISENMWIAFELMFDTFINGGEIYLEEMMPALDNFVQYGARQLAVKPNYIHSLYTMISRMYEDINVGGVDRVCACKLAEVLMLCLRGHLDKYIDGFIDIAMTILLNAENKVRIVKVHLIEMVINAIYYNPVMALSILESKGRAADFFSLWLSSIGSFTRVHDKKLSILAITVLLNMSPDQIPASVASGYMLLLPGIAELFKTLPSAMRKREDALRDDYNAEGTTLDLGDSDDWDEEEDKWNDEEDPIAEEPVLDKHDETKVYLDFLDQEAEKLGEYGDEENELGEESAVHDSPLDQVEPYLIFRAVLLRMQHEQPTLYSRLTTNLTSGQKCILESVVMNSQVASQLNLARQAAQMTPVASTTNGVAMG